MVETRPDGSVVVRPKLESSVLHPVVILVTTDEREELLQGACEQIPLSQLSKGDTTEVVLLPMTSETRADGLRHWASEDDKSEVRVL